MIPENRSNLLESWPLQLLDAKHIADQRHTARFFSQLHARQIRGTICSHLNYIYCIAITSGSKTSYADYLKAVFEPRPQTQ